MEAQSAAGAGPGAGPRGGGSGAALQVSRAESAGTGRLCASRVSVPRHAISQGYG